MLVDVEASVQSDRLGPAIDAGPQISAVSDKYLPCIFQLTYNLMYVCVYVCMCVCVVIIIIIIISIIIIIYNLLTACFVTFR